MDYVAHTTPSTHTTSSHQTATPCQWSADDFYPASLLAWLRQQTEPPHSAPHSARHSAPLEYEGV